MKYGTVNSLQSPRFAGVKTFMRMQNVKTLQDIDFAVVGIPFDTCATYRAGARFGPTSIREMSSLAAKPYNPELAVDIFEECSGVDFGDLGSVPGYVEIHLILFRKRCRKYLRMELFRLPWEEIIVAPCRYCGHVEQFMVR